MCFDGEPLVELPGHQRLAVAHPDDFTFFQALDLGRMGVGDFAASDNCYLEHTVSPARRLWKYRRNPSSVDTFGVQPSLDFSFSLL